MQFEKSYRLKVTNLGDFTKFVSGYRAYALRLMISAYGEGVAKLATKHLDLHALGLRDAEPDFLAYAISQRKQALSKTDNEVFAPQLNCVINYFFVGNAILAQMTHGSERLQKAFESRREVVRWGWSQDMMRPYHIGEAAWDERRKYWEQVSKLSYDKFGKFEFRLIEKELPKIGWQSISKCIPSIEWRIQQAVRSVVAADGADVAKLSEIQKKRYLERVSRSITGELDRKSFETRRQAEGKASSPPKSLKKDDRRNEEEDRPAPFVDHADIVISGDGRAFLAIPYVAFRPEDRIFVQIGSKDISFSQMGIQYGTVTNIPLTSRDYLRGLTSITIVEVQEVKGKRLLRAKHTAMVSDISVGEGLRKPLHTFKAKPRERGFEEI